MAHVILVSALGPNTSFFPFLVNLTRGSVRRLGQGLGLGLGAWLDNYRTSSIDSGSSNVKFHSLGAPVRSQ